MLFVNTPRQHGQRNGATKENHHIANVASMLTEETVSKSEPNDDLSESSEL